jgi:predicted N-formylglutamate amidohydrolase
MKNYLIISCEHASYAIPVEYRYLFASDSAVLTTHEGYDIGALELAQRLAKLADYALFANTSRLLVELNRSLHHPKLFSRFTQPLTKDQRQGVLSQYYHPYRQQLEDAMQLAIINKQRIIHLSIHSFTPELHGQKRDCAIGLLYDSRRKREKDLCHTWRKLLLRQNGELRIRMNYPYAGKADGFTTYLRQQFDEQHYLGIELEVNQQFPLHKPAAWQELQQKIYASVEQLNTYQ